MRIKNLILSVSAGVLALATVSCENKDIEFPDYDGGITAYFAYQYPIRTITLGDITTYDNTSDNEHRFTIYGTMGGSYKGKNINVDIAVDPSLVENLYFEDGVTPVKVLPNNYYSLSGNQLNYNGNMRGGVEVQLTDAFFNDTASIQNSYVIPIVMTGGTGFDKINSGEYMANNTPARTDKESWNSLPKDFVLFCVNYINKYDANYLRSGVDQVATFVKNKVEPIKIEAGAMNSANYDNQIFLVSSIPFSTDSTYEITMKVKADKPASIGTQTHKGAGNYTHWFCIGNVDFTTEWKEFKFSGKFSKEQNESNCIAFNLNDLAEANTYYFDNIVLKVNGKDAIVNGVTGSYAYKYNYGDNAGNIISKDYWNYDYSKTNEPNTITRNKGFVEKNEIIKATTKSLNSVSLPITDLIDANKPVSCDLLLTFDENDECTISSLTDGYKAEGKGKFMSKAAIKAWGNKDRDALYLDYKIYLEDGCYQSTDTLIVRDRGTVSSIREFNTVYKK